ncbi:class I SAM-dependent methyltransferase [bacterium LRH843]|nr:class I SAM-dependent methyltransferase [bacterium LRH843]
MIVTTSRRHANKLEERAAFFSKKLHCSYVVRGEVSVQDLIDRYENDVFVVGREKVTLYPKQGGEPFFFHPNSGMFRVKQFMKTGYDPFIETAGLKKGMTLLDCTLGLAADSLLAKVAVGSTGHVIGLEASPVLAAIVQDGLQMWQDGEPYLLQAMKEIEVVHANHFDYLRTLEDNSVDVVYFDPMFEQALDRSIGIKGLKQFACQDDLTEETINEAYRVCRSKIVLKDHWQSRRFEKYQFNVHVRKHTVFHYGYIDKSRRTD